MTSTPHGKMLLKNTSISTNMKTDTNSQLIMRPNNQMKTKFASDEHMSQFISMSFYPSKRQFASIERVKNHVEDFQELITLHSPTKRTS